MTQPAKHDGSGVCLPGGGALGSRQAGTLKALSEYYRRRGTFPKRVSMASVGTLNGLLFVQSFTPGDNGLSIASMEKLWKEIKPRDIRGRWPNISPWGPGLYHTKPLRAILTKHIDVAALRASPVQFEVRATAYGRNATGDPKASAIDNDLLDIAQASASYPFYFRPIRARGRVLADAGIGNNIPIQELEATGIRRIWIAATGLRPGDKQGWTGKRGPTLWKQIGFVLSELMEAQVNLQRPGPNTELRYLYGTAPPRLDTLEFNAAKCGAAFDAAYARSARALARFERRNERA